MKLITHLHVIPLLRMHEVITSTPEYAFAVWFFSKHMHTVKCESVKWMELASDYI